MQLAGKKILLGVSGSISAYKAAELTRLFVKEGVDVQVVMTQSAKDFVTPLTLSTLSGKPVLSNFSNPESGQWNNHVELGAWCDLMLIAPMSAHTGAKLANGYCEDLLSAIYLSAKCPVFLAPAMDHDMFLHPSTQSNIAALARNGNIIIGPEHGFLASGLTGIGRLTEPVDILGFISNYLRYQNSCKGQKVLVSAGPTREAIDPVRYISNHSSGKMGLAIARAFLKRGAEVELVVGPGVEMEERPGLNVHRVISADDMYDICTAVFQKVQIAVMAAAVSDFKPAKAHISKIKKSGKDTSIEPLELVQNKDILAELGRKKQPGQLLVGFALETDNELTNAITKFESKNLDLIVLNSLRDDGAGFGTDTNLVTLLDKSKIPNKLPLKPKSEVADDIVNYITENIF
jgi:phosphopantothenoylcysteine decarboxylase/phosphopantothenate--cysteine ligase